MTSPTISTLVVDIFTRSFVIPNDVSVIFNCKPNGDCYIAHIPVRGSNIISIASLYANGYSIKSFSCLELLFSERGEGCLLYTSDAADERSSVDLGGRRIIKK